MNDSPTLGTSAANLIEPQTFDAVQLPAGFLAKGTESKKTVINSNFHIIINSNKSFATLPQEQSIIIGKKLIFTSMKLKEAFESGRLLKPFGYASQPARWKAPLLVKFDYGLERNSRADLIHVHLVASFEGQTHIHNQQLRDFIKAVMQPECDNVFIDIKFISDYLNTLGRYIKKDQ